MMPGKTIVLILVVGMALIIRGIACVLSAD